MSFFKWFAGFFEDIAGTASSKRAALYICLFFFWRLIDGSLKGSAINQDILFVTVGMILFCVGAVTTENITNIVNRKGDKNEIN